MVLRIGPFPVSKERPVLPDRASTLGRSGIHFPGAKNSAAPFMPPSAAFRRRGDDIDKSSGAVLYMNAYRLSRPGIIPEPGPRAVDFHPQDSSYEKQLPTCGFLHDAAA